MAMVSIEKRLDAALTGAVAQGIFPGATLLVAQRGGIALQLAVGRLTYRSTSQPVDIRTVYDLASLTKVLSTTLLAMIFVDQGRFGLETPLRELWPDPIPADKQRLTVGQLLAHVSGLPAWKPLYRLAEARPVRHGRSTVAQAILTEPPVAPPDRRVIYSDLNFMLLGFILEHLSQCRQDELFKRLIAEPLHLSTVGYRPGDRHLPVPRNLAPTETRSRRSGPPGDPDTDRRPGVPRGMVHDDNAAALTGVAGHAGLFGDLTGIWEIFEVMRRAWSGEDGLVTEGTVQKFWRPVGPPTEPVRAYGFDRPSAGGSPGRRISPNSVGHTGFTGTSLWHDLTRDLTVILLTNRVHPTAGNWAIKEFRPRLHDLVVEAFG